MPPCVFCDLSKITGPIEWMVVRGHDVIVFAPLGPCTIGHQLVVPVEHVADATVDPKVTGAVAEVAARVAARWASANIITSIGEPATQTVSHAHLHVVPRRVGDGLPLPWTPQQSRRSL